MALAAHLLARVRRQRWRLVLGGRCSQVGGGLARLPLSGLRQRHAQALQPLLGVLPVLRLQHVRPAVGEDLEGPRQAALTPLPGHHLHRETARDLHAPRSA